MLSIEPKRLRSHPQPLAPAQIKHLHYTPPEPGFDYVKPFKPGRAGGTIDMTPDKIWTCSCGSEPLSIYFNPWAALGELREVVKCVRCPAVLELLNQPDTAEA